MKAEEQIKHDLATYFQKNNVTDIEKAIDELIKLLTPSVFQALDLVYESDTVQAWTALQILEDLPFRYHASKELGTFIYNTEMYTLKSTSYSAKYLHYNSKYKGPIELPEGCINTRLMFVHSELPEGFTLGDKFDTSNVTDMESMFEYCELPEGFTLGNKFDTSNVKNMMDMFTICILPKGFTLGDKFDTSNVENMSFMFHGCELPEGFTLGDNFDTSNVKNMYCMFRDCIFPEGFTLGDKFDTPNVINIDYMFLHCKLPRGIDNTLSSEEIISQLKR